MREGVHDYDSREGSFVRRTIRVIGETSLGSIRSIHQPFIDKLLPGRHELFDGTECMRRIVYTDTLSIHTELLRNLYFCYVILDDY